MISMATGLEKFRMNMVISFKKVSSKMTNSREDLNNKELSLRKKTQMRILEPHFMTNAQALKFIVDRVILVLKLVSKHC